MLLRQWSRKANIHTTYPTTETGAVSVTVSTKNPFFSLLWDLDDYTVDSRSDRHGVAVIWLTPRPYDEPDPYGNDDWQPVDEYGDPGLDDVEGMLNAEVHFPPPDDWSRERAKLLTDLYGSPNDDPPGPDWPADEYDNGDGTWGPVPDYIPPHGC